MLRPSLAKLDLQGYKSPCCQHFLVAHYLTFGRADLLGLVGEVTAGRQQLALPSVASRLCTVLKPTSTSDSPGYSQAQVSLFSGKVALNAVLVRSIAVRAVCLGCLPNQTTTARLETRFWSRIVKDGILWG